MYGTIGLDIECTKLPYIHPWQTESFLVTVGLVDEMAQKKVWIFNHDEIKDPRPQREMIDEIQEEISQAKRIVGHNLKFDLNWMRYLGVDFSKQQLFCTQVAEYLILGQRGMGKLSLHDLSVKYLSVDKIDRVKIMWDAGYETSEIPLSILVPYQEQDCYNALAIYQRQAEIIDEMEMNALVAVQMETIRVLSEIECNGMKFDVGVAHEHISRITSELEEIDWKLRDAIDIPNINLDSAHELSVVLYGGTLKQDGEEWVIREFKDYSTYYPRKAIIETPIKGLGFDPPKGSETKFPGIFQTNKNVIKILKAKTKKQKDVKALLIKRSKLAKALETMVSSDGTKGLINKVMADGCIHSQYNMTIAKTGRLTSSDPNGQNLPREGTSPVKLAIIPRFDFILECDLSQIEWRGVAFLSQDKVMIQEIIDGVDPHTENAIRFFGADPDKDPKKFKELRTVAKIMTFRLIYGGSAYSFYMDQKMPNYSRKKWQGIVDAFYAKYYGLARWQEENIRKVYRQGGKLVNPTGRRFVFFRDEKGGYRPQQIKNFPVQSFSTADLMPLAMIVIYKRYRAGNFKSKIIGQVHDALIFDVRKDELEALAKLCLDVFKDLPGFAYHYWGIRMNVPIKGDADYGPNWGELEELKMAA